MVVTRKNFKKVTRTLFANKKGFSDPFRRCFQDLFTGDHRLEADWESATTQRVPRGLRRRTGSTVLGRGLGTRVIGQPSKPKAFRNSPERCFLY